MNRSAVFVIARKEFRDVLRDRRTLVFMMLLPIVVMPVLMIGVFKFVSSQQQARQSKTVTMAAEPMAVNTLQALRDAWFDRNSKALAVLAGRLQLESFSGVGDLEKLVERLGQIEQLDKDSGGAAGASPADPVTEETADGSGEDQEALRGRALVAGLEAFKDFDDHSRQLLADAKDVFTFLANTEFVGFDELSGEGQLAQGVEIPEDVPDPLSDEAVTLAIQTKEIAAALQVAPTALLTLDEVPEALPFDALRDGPDGAPLERSEVMLLSRVDGLATVPVSVLYDSSQSLSDEAHDRLQAFVEAINRFALVERLERAELPRDYARPVALERANVATASRKIQAFLGGLLPYLLFAFCFFGALYPALDVTAGEKERFTLETLLLGPVTRFEIALGKFLVVFVAAIVAAVLTTASMALTFTHGVLPAEAVASLDIEFQPLALGLTGSLILPVAALYAAALLAVGLYARSFKEAQSYTVPLQFLFVLPTMVSLIPDVEAESHLAWIPFVNISVLMKELLKGNYLWGFYGITLVSTLVLTVVALFVCSWLFRRESVLLRT